MRKLMMTMMLLPLLKEGKTTREINSSPNSTSPPNNRLRSKPLKKRAGLK